MHELHGGDLDIGHRRVYDQELRSDHLRLANLSVFHWEGSFLKPLSNAQMQYWPEMLIRTFRQVGRELPDYCAELYVVAVPGG